MARNPGVHGGIIPAYAGSTFPSLGEPTSPEDHPRIRGEHLNWTSTFGPPPGSSPHTRGALWALHSDAVESGIIPAYAGSTRAPRRDRRSARDHPRIRGEHNGLPNLSVNCWGSSPHTRGARQDHRPQARRGGIIPAYAGSTRRLRRRSSRFRDHPRIRGEHVPKARYNAFGKGSSPHTRGAPSSSVVLSVGSGIIPAYAGSTPTPSTSSSATWDHPRIRGEHSGMADSSPTTAGSFPHTRGARTGLADESLPARIIPAYAGSTPVSRSGPGSARDHPRIRGEHVEKAGETSLGTGSSPHTRGAPLVAYAVRGRHGIIPAYAGSTHGRAGELWRRGDHPRIRGEHAGSGASGLTSKGSSPHTRGARHRTAAPCARPRIIPAYAGSTSSTTRRRRGTRDHPRIRGEHTTLRYPTDVVRGSSPHTRGAPRGRPRARALRGIIPAYAGSTRSCRRLASRCRDHPRIRGEHKEPARRVTRAEGSSPHTRGARMACWPFVLRTGIIPAYAGSTRQP